MQRCLGMTVVRRFLRDVENLVVEWVDRDLHDAALRRFRAAGRRLSLVDRASLELARRNSMRTCIGFDPEFDAQGPTRFRSSPPSS